VREEVRRILSTGIMNGGKLVLHAGNNIAAMYNAARESGRYE
jgi:hypothetical protein